MNRFMIGSMLSLGLLIGLATSQAEDKLPANDTEFLIKFTSDNHAEIKFSELADTRASNPRVKEFAQRMVKDHTAAAEKLAEHAKNQKVAVAAGFEREKRDIYMNLSRLNGAEFDKAYMKQMVEDHEKGIKMLEHEARSGQDAELKKFAEELLPAIRDHLKQAREINDEVNK